MKKPQIDTGAIFSESVQKVMREYKEGKPIDKDKVKEELINSGMARLMLMQMNRKQEEFIRIKNRFGRTPKRRFFTAGNKTGKTRIGIAEDIAYSMGYRPWLKKDDPDYKIAVKVPNQGLIGCETMLESVPGKIEPELRLLIPSYCTVPEDWKNGSQGVLKSVTLRYNFLGEPCGSVINIRSYNQEARTFEGIDYDWEHWDEPPNEDILQAAERGKITTNAPSWFTMTPILGAYIRNRFSMKAFNNGGTDDEVADIKSSAWENCQDWCRSCDVYIPENDPEKLEPGKMRPVERCPGCGKIMGFVSKGGLEEYFKTIPPEMRESREEGKWLSLSGMVYKELAVETHMYDDFEIPKKWMKIESVDPHDARPTRWLLGAVSPEDIVINSKPANRIYWFDYLLAEGNVEEIVRQVRVKRANHNYVEPSYVILDAKFGAKTIKTRADETSWEEELYNSGIKNIRLSHSNPGDVALGHKIVKEYLKPHYSVVKGKSFPGMMFARGACRGERGPWEDMTSYQWKPGTEKPEEDYKDMCDCVRYAALEQPRYQEPQKEIDPKVIEFLLEERKRDLQSEKYFPLSWGLRVSA